MGVSSAADEGADLLDRSSGRSRSRSRSPSRSDRSRSRSGKHVNDSTNAPIARGTEPATIFDEAAAGSSHGRSSSSGPSLSGVGCGSSQTGHSASGNLDTMSDVAAMLGIGVELETAASLKDAGIMDEQRRSGRKRKAMSFFDPSSEWGSYARGRLNKRHAASHGECTKPECVAARKELDALKLKLQAETRR